MENDHFYLFELENLVLWARILYYSLFDILRFNIPSAKICAKMSPEADLRPGSMFLSVRKLTSVHPETPEGANWSFQFINEQFAARSRKSRDCAETYFT